MTTKMQYAKVINPETQEVQIGVGCPVEYYMEIGMEWMETEDCYNGRWYKKGFAPQEPDPKPKTREEVQQIRESLYKSEVDPITAHIQRLRDQEQTETVVMEINKLIIERDLKYTNIQIENPYPEEGK